MLLLLLSHFAFIFGEGLFTNGVVGNTSFLTVGISFYSCKERTWSSFDELSRFIKAQMGTLISAFIPSRHRKSSTFISKQFFRFSLLFIYECFGVFRCNIRVINHGIAKSSVSTPTYSIACEIRGKFAFMKYLRITHIYYRFCPELSLRNIDSFSFANSLYARV